MNNERLGQLMKERGVSQTTLGEAVGVSHAFVNYMLKGIKTPSVATLKRIANYFNVPMDDLA